MIVHHVKIADVILDGLDLIVMFVYLLLVVNMEHALTSPSHVFVRTIGRGHSATELSAGSRINLHKIQINFFWSNRNSCQHGFCHGIEKPDGSIEVTRISFCKICILKKG